MTLMTPVALPPGLARLITRPAPTGSVPVAKTMGITLVARVLGASTPTRRMASVDVCARTDLVWPARLAPIASKRSLRAST